VVAVLTWNVQHASPGRSQRQAEWLSGTAADLLVLTEVPAGAGQHILTAALAASGYHTYVPGGGKGDYRVLLAARGEELQPLADLRSAHLPHRLAAARVDLPSGTVALVGLYVPSRGPRHRRNADKRAFQDAVTHLLPRIPDLADGRPVVVTGDLNVVEPDHVPHHRVFGGWEYDFYRAFRRCGLVDAYRHLHPDVTDHSWFGHSGAGYRFDHLFVTTAHAGWLSDCHYLQAPRLDGLSDHAALTATLLRTEGP
jgi:exonuclease III